MKKIKILKPKFRTNIKELHDQYLENLVYHLDFIGENKKEISWIFKDGLWRREGDRLEYNMLCDLLIIYNSRKGIPIELKGQNKSQRKKARKQIISGKNFLEEVLKISVPYGKLVTYSQEGYSYRKYYFAKEGLGEWGDWEFASFNYLKS